jgi:hypothetical protein
VRDEWQRPQTHVPLPFTFALLDGGKEPSQMKAQHQRTRVLHLFFIVNFETAGSFDTTFLNQGNLTTDFHTFGMTRAEESND